jgi:acetyl-CoA carboxylase beta subunit
LLEHGMLDLVVDRRELKATIARALRFLGCTAAVQPQPPAEVTAESDATLLSSEGV